MVWVPVPPDVMPVPPSMTSILAGVPAGAVPGAIVTAAAEAPKVRLLMSVLLSRVEARAELMVTLELYSGNVPPKLAATFHEAAPRVTALGPAATWVVVSLRAVAVELASENVWPKAFVVSIRNFVAPASRAVPPAAVMMS